MRKSSCLCRCVPLCPTMTVFSCFFCVGHRCMCFLSFCFAISFLLSEARHRADDIRANRSCRKGVSSNTWSDTITCAKRCGKHGAARSWPTLPRLTTCWACSVHPRPHRDTVQTRRRLRAPASRPRQCRTASKLCASCSRTSRRTLPATVWPTSSGATNAQVSGMG